MTRLHKWLWETFLPVWAKESLLRENEKLRRRNGELEQEIRRLNAYTDGLETGMRIQRRIVINNGGTGK